MKKRGLVIPEISKPRRQRQLMHHRVCAPDGDEVALVRLICQLYFVVLAHNYTKYCDKF